MSNRFVTFEVSDGCFECFKIGLEGLKNKQIGREYCKSGHAKHCQSGHGNPGAVAKVRESANLSSNSRNQEVPDRKQRPASIYRCRSQKQRLSDQVQLSNSDALPPQGSSGPAGIGWLR
jgi:hypothetical protein